MSRAREIADRDLAGNELILDADNDTSITADTDDTINFKVGGSDRLTINSSGDIDVETGDIFFSGSAKGINLGVTSNTDSNTLDDYEEGTWTPAAQSFSGTFGSSEAQYIKVGRLVHVHVSANFNGTDSSRVVITGLPFTANNTAAVSLYFSNAANSNFDTVKFLVSGTTFVGADTDGDVTYTTLTGANPIRFTAMYYSDS